jgi:3-mercaptopyruvate sulfurtransferase SseA
MYRPTPQVTSAERCRWTGRPSCRLPSRGTSWTRRPSKNCSPVWASTMTTPSCCTAATTTGFAAYAYWEFRLYGHDRVKLLDGGRKKWELDGRELVGDVPTRPGTRYVAHEQDLSIRAFREEVLTSIGEKNLVDVRSPDEFSGKIKAPAHLSQAQSQRAGHIPGAINIPWSQAAAEDGTFRSDGELTMPYGAQGFTTTNPPSLSTIREH